MNKEKGKFYRHITDKGVKKPYIVLCIEDCKYGDLFKAVVVRDDENPDSVGDVCDTFYSDVFQPITTKINFGKLQ